MQRWANQIVMPKRATKQETELRVAHAAELVAEGQAYSSITSLVAAKYGISRRRARQITSNAYLLLKNDIEEGDLNRPEMTAKLVCTLENAMHRAMREKQYYACLLYTSPSPRDRLKSRMPSSA